MWPFSTLQSGMIGHSRPGPSVSGIQPFPNRDMLPLRRHEIKPTRSVVIGLDPYAAAPR